MMPKILIGFFLIIALLLSCKNKNEQGTQEYSEQLEAVSTIKSAHRIIPLNPKSKELVEDWPEYEKFSDLVGQYQEISLTDALLNSKELSEMAKQLRDSIRVEQLNIPSIKMRLNVLHSETMRLADMATIPTITELSILRENNNVIQAFSALNLKINNMESMEKLNDEISAFVNEVMAEQDSIPVPEKKGLVISKDSI
jgi:predicted CoA-binding protein